MGDLVLLRLSRLIAWKVGQVFTNSATNWRMCGKVYFRATRSRVFSRSPMSSKHSGVAGFYFCAHLAARDNDFLVVPQPSVMERVWVQPLPWIFHMFCANVGVRFVQGFPIVLGLGIEGAATRRIAHFGQGIRGCVSHSGYVRDLQVKQYQKC